MPRRTPAPLSSAFEAAENIPTNTSANPTLGDVIAERLSRRDLVHGLLAISALGTAVSPLALLAPGAAHAEASNTTPTFNFKEVAAGAGATHEVAEGYDADILMRWGDPVLPGAPAFDPHNLTKAGQARQFGYNNDYLAYFALPGAAAPSEHGLLCVNHEYTNEELMFPGLGRQDVRRGGAGPFAKMTQAIAEVEMMAHGGSVLEIEKTDGKWAVVANSRYARRITAETEVRLTGPAAGHDRLKTSADPTGTRVLGMLNNCAGGRTPWGTWLSCEENINGYFSGELPQNHPELRNHKRMGIPGRWYNWGDYVDRFNIGKEPNEANRFGWIVEINPFDPTSMPVKRTALGRFKHEGAAGILNKDGRYVIYSGDDQRFDYVYRFVTAGRFEAGNPADNLDLLDSGSLAVARFNADGTGDWLPLVHGQGALREANGFASQADVLIEARSAADLIGATKMDRPEDIEANAKTNKVYVMLTNNSQRKPEQVDAANPRADNRFGHIIEITPDAADHAAAGFRWEILVRCGDPSLAAVGATFNPNTSEHGWFGMPDNCAVDAMGRLWIATDGNDPKRTGRADGLWAMETEGAARATSKLFFRCPHGAEMCGPEFTPDATTLFLAVQHPGESDESDAAAEPASFEAPATRWPDFKEGIPPRPAIVAITRKGGGKIGV
ncbi:MAG TPA: PhoX family phosphatase [Hyphomicrobiaceae bacterium]|nr:PhoX family phosphatase [Hyphomicrobiaceae bacterium]